MKSIVLIKSHPCVQLGHVYEHLFLRRINDFFYEQQLFKSLDYAAHGTTFEEGGVIIVEIELYSEEAQKYMSALEQLKISLDEDNENVSRALFQILAEESVQLRVTNKQTLIHELLKLDLTPWQSIDSFKLLDTRAIRKKTSPVHLTRYDQAKPRPLTMTLTVDNSLDSKYSPLFNTVSRILLLTVSNVISYKYGLYVTDFDGRAKPLSMTSRLHATPAITSDIRIEEIMKLSLETITYILSVETRSRLIREITSTNYLSQSDLAPNFEKVLQETGVMIGSQGWKRLANDEAVGHVLDNMTISARFGRRRENSQLST